MALRSIIAAALAAFAITTEATQTFANTGTTSGWSNILQEHQGTVSEVTNVVYKGSTAIKVTQTYDPSYTGRYHSEVHTTQGYHRGETGFYGFAFRLQQDWQFSPAQSYNLAQFIADFSDTGCDDWMPSSMVWIVGDQLYSRVKQGSVCAQHTQTFPNIATVSAGDWHRVEIQADWQNDGTGYYKLWFDGVKVLEQYNLDTTIDDSREFQFHVGLYANGWHDDGKMLGTQPFRQVWYDQIAMGTTFADANPSAW
ncbi:polysaccharide lyase family 20 protein [Diplogelasinospora grovesii]|uniref:Polysaccharide lyase family 20 protein n=1 Tax=Diplogelasinospora grovesii TaxID=303347 RepID=A0AAN6S060_9PEZI|nr:polysaccharide lyase family 20 protein [Diplogelasinospora grovesii]